MHYNYYYLKSKVRLAKKVNLTSYYAKLLNPLSVKSSLLYIEY